MRKNVLLILLLLIGIFCSATQVQAQKWAVKTNLLYWATGTLNAGGELTVSKHSTVNLTFNLNPWVYGVDNKIQHWFLRPEYRYWVTEAHTRLFFSAHVMGGGFEVGGFKVPFIGDNFERLKNLVYTYHSGTFVAAGFGLGYSFYLSPHLNLEVSGGVGIARIKHHAEPNTRHPEWAGIPWRGHDKVNYLPVPTELSISLVYLFNGKNKK